jgi:hypothetical protein
MVVTGGALADTFRRACGPDLAETEDCAAFGSSATCQPVAEAVIEREEVVGLLFNVADIVVVLEQIGQLLTEDDGEEEADAG